MTFHEADIYDLLLKKLEPTIKDKNLDPVAVSSMIRSCVEIDDENLTCASRYFYMRGRYYSVKPSNIKINLKFAIQIIMKFKGICTDNELWLIASIIDIAQYLFSNATKEIDQMSAMILLALYRLLKADKQQINNYIERLNSPDNPKPNLCQLQDLLDQLEDIGCIKCIDGYYVLNESIDYSTSKKFKEYID